MANPLSVTSGDSSPKGGAKSLSLWERWQRGSADGEGKPPYNSLNARSSRNPASPLFSGWNWVPYTRPAFTTPVTGRE